MSIFDRLFKNNTKEKAAAWATQIQAVAALNTGLTTIYPAWQAMKETEMYRTIDDIYSIVTFLAETSATIPFYGYKVVKDEQFKRYKNATGMQQKYFKTKGLEDLPENSNTAKFLESLSFDEKVSFYLALYLNGEVFIYLDKQEVGPNAGRIMPVLMPGQYISIVVTGGWPGAVSGYKYDDGSTDFKLEANEVIHIKYSNPDNKWRGLSPLMALKRRVTRVIAGLNISVAQMQNGGLPGVVYEKNLANGDLNKRKDDFGKFINNKGNSGAPYWIDGELGYIQIGSPLADMQIAEIADIDFKKLCNAYRFPSQLLNNDKASTDNNMLWAEKRLYTNAIRPNVTRMAEGFIVGLQLRSKGEYIEADFSNVESLQADMKMQADALRIMDWITPNEKREIQRFDRSDNPIMDEIIIGSGVQLLSDLEAIQDNEITKDYGG